MCVGSVVVRNVVNYGVEDFRGMLEGLPGMRNVENYGDADGGVLCLKIFKRV